jgi:hypothetical protein
MCFVSEYVENSLHCHGGQPPARSLGIQALNAACMLRDHTLGVETVTAASALCGVNHRYTVAAITVLAAGDKALVDDVLAGRIHLLTAADQVKNRARLIAAYQAASPEDRLALARAIGVDKLFDTAIAPLLVAAE